MDEEQETDPHHECREEIRKLKAHLAEVVAVCCAGRISYFGAYAGRTVQIENSLIDKWAEAIK